MEKHWRTVKNICTVSPIWINGQFEGNVYMFQNTSYIRNLVSKITIQFMSTFLLTILITFISIVYLSKKVTKPILQMKEQTHLLTKGIYNQTFELNSNDEIGELSVAISKLGEELLEIKKNRNEFLASVAHELRTPLTYIQGYLDVISQGEFSLKEQEKFLSIIRKETQQLTFLIEDLFLLARMDENQFRIEKQKVNLDDFLSNMVNRSEVAFAKNGVELTYLSTNTNCDVHLDVQRMEQVLMNILKNAVNHTPSGGQINVWFESSPTEVTIYCRDNGEGIPKEELNRVFERFYRVNKARTRKNGGSGLGLAIIKEIIEKHEGKIYIESQVNVGTVIKIILPIYE